MEEASISIGISREATDDILSTRETFFVLSSRDFLRAASFALFASISARRRSARDSADDILPRVTRYADSRRLLKERHLLFLPNSLLRPGAPLFVPRNSNPDWPLKSCGSSILQSSVVI